MDGAAREKFPSTVVAVTAAVLFAVTVTCSGSTAGNQTTWTCPSRPPSATYATGSWPDSVAVGDFDGDGRADVAVANWSSATVSVLRGVGDGTFGAKVDYATDASIAGSSTCGQGIGASCTAVFVAIGDFNGDGKLDLAVANARGQSVSVFLGNGDGTFRTRVDRRTSGQPSSLVVADFDRDGVSDLAVTNVGAATGQVSTASMDIFYGDRSGTLQTAVRHLGSDVGAEFAVAADFDADGSADLAVTSPSSSSISVFRGNGDGTFLLPAARYSLAGAPSQLAVGDFNGDGRPDLAVVSSETSMVNVFVAVPTGALEPKFQHVMNATQAVSIAAGDFNGDRHTDLVVGVASTRTIAVLVGRGDGTFQQAAADYGTTVNPLALAPGDFNRDGRDELAVAQGCATSRCDTNANDTLATFAPCSP